MDGNTEPLLLTIVVVAEPSFSPVMLVLNVLLPVTLKSVSLGSAEFVSYVAFTVK